MCILQGGGLGTLQAGRRFSGGKVARKGRRTAKVLHFRVKGCRGGAFGKGRLLSDPMEEVGKVFGMGRQRSLEEPNNRRDA